MIIEIITLMMCLVILWTVIDIKQDQKLRRIIKLAIKSVEQYRYADDENEKWRDRHKDLPALKKIITDEEHLKVEALYDKASDMMDEVIKLWEKS